MLPELVQVVACHNVLGEGVQWDAHEQAVWWTDIQAARLYRYDWRRQQLEDWALPERLGAFALTQEPGVILCAFASGFARYDLNTADCHWLDRPEAGYRGIRMNDGRVDRQGRFWCGSMAESETAVDADGKPVLGSLYCLDQDKARHVLANISIANSLCWNLAGTTMYFADSPTASIHAFAFDADTATVDKGRLFARCEGSAVPDGSCVDSEDCLWNAEWGGGRVTRYRPDGSVNLHLALPVTQPTCVAFGGPDLQHLIVTTAREGLTPQVLAQQPEAGNLFIYKTPYQGVPESRLKS